MMRVRLAVPDAAVGPHVIDAALEAVTRTDEALLEAGRIPLAADAIRRGVRWRPEPPGDEHFDMAETVMRRGHGDCDDLAPWHAASLRHTGEDPEARATVVRSGPSRWHAVVRRGDGSIDDPSKDAGMGRGPYKPPVQPRLKGDHRRPRIVTRQLASFFGKPVFGARCDVPWRGSHYALSGHGLAGSRHVAASAAIQGAVVVGQEGGVIEPEHAARLAALDGLLCGVPREAVLDALRRVHGGSQVGFFGDLIKTAVSLAPIPGAGLISNLLPGDKPGAAPAPGVAPAAAPAAARRPPRPARGGGGYGYGPSYGYGPGAQPIIVRF